MANIVISGTGAARAPEDPTNHPNNAFYIYCATDNDAFHAGLVTKFIKIEAGSGFPAGLYYISGYTEQDLGDGVVRKYLSLSSQIAAGASGGVWSIVIGDPYIDGTGGSNLAQTPFGTYYLCDTDAPMNRDYVGLQVTLSANDKTEGLAAAGDYWIVDCPTAQLDGPGGKKFPIFTLARVSDNQSTPALAGMRSVSWTLKSGVGARLPYNIPDYSVTWRKKGVLVGDSTTYLLGTDVNTPGDPDNHNPGNRYRDALRAKFPNSTIQDADIKNCGVRGATSTDWRQGTAYYNAAIAALQALGNPDFVDIDLGMNQENGQTIEQYVDDLRSLCGGIRALYPNIIIVLNEPLWTWDPGRDPAWNEACKEALHTIGFQTVVGTLELQDHSKATKGLQPDLVHSNSAGQYRDATFRVRGLAPYLTGDKTIPPIDGGGGGDGPTAEEIAVAVRLEMDNNSTKLSGITQAQAALPLAVWNVPTADSVNSLTMGKRIIDYLTGNAYTRLGAPVGASIAADIAANKAVGDAIKQRTDNLPAQPASRTDVQVTVEPTVLSPQSIASLVAEVVDGVRTSEWVQRLTARLGLWGLTRVKVGNITTDTAPREDGGSVKFRGTGETSVEIVDNTLGDGTDGEPGSEGG